MTAPVDWARRFEQQATWTSQMRRHLYQEVNLGGCHRIMEVGCGPGAILRDLPPMTSGTVHGLDIDFGHLLSAAAHFPGPRLTCGDVHRLPYRPASFDAVLCHYFLLWVQPDAALREMVRVTRPGGYILALAEPDYGSRIDYPPELAELGTRQRAALASQGADPDFGRKLSACFHSAGLRQVRTGVIGGFWAGPPQEADHQLEWAALRSDLAGQYTAAELDDLEQADLTAWQSGTRTLYVPTFYAVGQV